MDSNNLKEELKELMDKLEYDAKRTREMLKQMQGDKAAEETEDE